MSQPSGFTDVNFPTHVCKLRKVIYRLKQAPKAWYTELTKCFLVFGFTRPIVDASLFIYNQSTNPLYLIVYVDDIIITSPNATNLDVFIKSLANRFSLKDFGALSYFLGAEVTPTPKGLFLSQMKYIMDLLERFNIQYEKPTSTPVVANPPSTLMSGDLLDDPTEYWEAVRSLQYLTLTILMSYMLSTSCHSTCTSHTIHIRQRLNAYSDSFVVHRKKEFILFVIHHLFYMLLPMSVRQ